MTSMQRHQRNDVQRNVTNEMTLTKYHLTVVLTH